MVGGKIPHANPKKNKTEVTILISKKNSEQGILPGMEKKIT